MRLNPISFALSALLVLMAILALSRGVVALGVPLILLALLVAAALQMARQWERAIVLRAGRFVGVTGPGLFWIVPVVDTMKFVAAARLYADNPTALHLRGMNMLYESVKERGSTVLVPSSAIDSMNLGGLAGLTALAKAARDDSEPKEDRS